MLLNNKNDARSFLEQTPFYDGQLSKADTHGWTVVLFFFLYFLPYTQWQEWAAKGKDSRVERGRQ